jgi:hypothetical protein
VHLFSLSVSGSKRSGSVSHTTSLQIAIAVRRGAPQSAHARVSGLRVHVRGCACYVYGPCRCSSRSKEACLPMIRLFSPPARASSATSSLANTKSRQNHNQTEPSRAQLRGEIATGHRGLCRASIAEIAEGRVDVLGSPLIPARRHPSIRGGTLGNTPYSSCGQLRRRALRAIAYTYRGMCVRT